MSHHSWAFKGVMNHAHTETLNPGGVPLHRFLSFPRKRESSWMECVEGSATCLCYYST